MPEINPSLSPELGPILDSSFSDPVAYQLHLSYLASQALQQEAETILEAHEQAISEYSQTLEQPDWYPFVSLPAGTEPRALPNGERLFVLPDGVFLQTTQDTHFVFVDQEGVPYQLPEHNGKVTLPDGRVFDVVLSAQAPRSVEWLEGLPPGVAPVPVREGHWRVEFPNGFRLEVSLLERIAVFIDGSGSVGVISPKLHAYHDTLEVNLLSNGSRGFAAKVAGYRGFVDQNGDILVALATGEDLAIRFPPGASGSEAPEQQRFYQCGTPV